MRRPQDRPPGADWIMMPCMQFSPVALVQYAEVMRGSVLVTFADGTSALYSAALLKAVLDQAEEVVLPPEED